MGTTTRDDIIALEQKKVDFAYDCYAARLAEMTGASVAGASASGKDSIANRMEAEERAAAYGGLGSESLVFCRVDAQEPGGATRPWYIGRRGVLDAESDPVVLLWTSPLAKKWYEASPDAPGEVVLRRQLHCAQHVVESYSDEISTTPLPATTEQQQPVPLTRVPTPGDIARVQRRKPMQPDDFLLRELQRSRSGSMRDIVETIRRDQMALVTGSPSDILVVQGGPGTGKSAVGLHRVTWLVNNSHFKASDILVVGPHQRFLDYVGQVLPTLGTRDVNAVQLSRLWDGDILGVDEPRVRLVKSDERMAAVLRRRVEHECRPEALDDLTTAPSYEGDEPAFTVAVGSTTLRLPRSEVLTLVEEVRDGSGAYRERRERFRTLLVDRLLRELTTIAPHRARDDTIRRDLERNRQVDRLIERVWPSPGAREALRTLYDSPDLLRTCAEAILDAEEQSALHRPRAARADEEPWSLDDRACLEELRYLISGETPRRYGHIVVDEAQDLTPMQARALRRRCAAGGGSMTVLGDLAQATGPYAHADWDRLGALLSDHGDWRVAELNTSYRVPAEIMEFVAPLARAIAPELTYPQAVREAGGSAVQTVATEPWALLDDTVAHVIRLAGSTDGRNLRSVAVIVPDDSNWLDAISRQLDESDRITAQEREAVSVMAAAQSKGMEYDHVLVVEPATIADRGPAGLRQLYIALTRSTQSLTVLHTSALPSALTHGDEGTPRPSEGTAPAAPADVPEIGTEIRVRVTGHVGGGNYKVEATSHATARPLLMAVRNGATPPAAGEELDAWVLRHDSNVTFVTVDGRGRKPISPTMAKRYVHALTVVEELVAGNVPADARTRLSELKGMANRCLRLDQHDWLDVWRVLGAPDRPRLTVLRDLAAHTARALASDALDLDRFRADLEQSGWAEAMVAARWDLERRVSTAGADQEAEHDQLPSPHQQNVSAPSEPTRTGEASGQPEPKEPLPMAIGTADTTSPHAGPTTDLLEHLQTSAAADRVCKTHEAVRLELMAALLRANLQPDSSPVVDVTCATEKGSILYEVLGAGRSAYPDLRSGAARLIEVNHTLPAPADHLYLVLSEPPADVWTADAVHDVFGVHVVWRTPAGWDGRNGDAGLGTGPA
ncbi:HelD family protein [Streptomyces sp. NPDC056462]|uniref:HelD family protein n=1 Tax=Streptomyces sp. NPDC056462 TaxID=3345826 RepID=UPI00367FFF8E